MTVTDEDRIALEALDDALGFLTDNERPIVLDYLVRHRQAAYVAGLERAAVIADGFDAPHVAGVAQRIATAIRAEKDKP